MKTIRIDPKSAGPEIPALLFGHNLEHTRRAMWQGLSAQLIANRKFAGPVAALNSSLKASGERGTISPEGVAAGWNPLGAAQVRFAHDTSLGFAGKQAQKIVVPAKATGGIAQSGIPLKQGLRYKLRLYAQVSDTASLALSLSDSAGHSQNADSCASLQPGGWRTVDFSFSPSQTDENSQLKIVFTGPATIWLGAVSLLPADNVFGMRRDVLERLKEISVPLLRWPGGNFTLDYRWQDGLLPVDQRPPILSGMSETLPFTGNCDFHEMGIDEFIGVCRYLQAEPFITVNVRPQDFGTAEDAASWVEYCNGNAQTKMGRVRAARGHAEPFAVKYWSIGNEIWGQHMLQGHCDAPEYARRVAQFAPAMKKADPSIVLTAVGLPAPTWDGIVVEQAGAHFDYLSGHDYLRLKEQDVEAYRILAAAPPDRLREKLSTCRRVIDEKAPSGKKIGIAFDEWNVWHNWFCAPFENNWEVGPGDAAYVAGVLNLFCREFEKLNIPLAAFFQPVNEGAVAVRPFSAELTAVGQVMKLYRCHQGQRLVNCQGDVEACASLNLAGDQLSLTLVSRDSGSDETLVLEVPARSAVAQIFFADDLTPNVPLNVRAEELVPKAGRATIVLPRFAVALVTLKLK